MPKVCMYCGREKIAFTLKGSNGEGYLCNKAECRKKLTSEQLSHTIARMLPIFLGTSVLKEGIDLGINKMKYLGLKAKVSLHG